MTMYQKPNKALIIALVAFGFYAIGQGVFQTAGLVVFTLSLTIWAWEEVRRGDGWFRRSIGIGALAALSVLLFIIIGKL